MIQLHLTNDVAQGSGRKALDSGNGLIDTVGVQLCVHDLKEHHRVDLHGHVIAGDHGLRGKVCHLFLQAYLFGNALNKGDLDVQAGRPCIGVAAQPLDDIYLGLRHDDDVGNNDQHQNKNKRKDDKK